MASGSPDLPAPGLLLAAMASFREELLTTFVSLASSQTSHAGSKLKQRRLHSDFVSVFGRTRKGDLDRLRCLASGRLHSAPATLVPFPTTLTRQAFVEVVDDLHEYLGGLGWLGGLVNGGGDESLGPLFASTSQTLAGTTTQAQQESSARKGAELVQKGAELAQRGAELSQKGAELAQKDAGCEQTASEKRKGILGRLSRKGWWRKRRASRDESEPAKAGVMGLGIGKKAPVLAAVVQPGITVEDVDEDITELFKRMDTNGDGWLSFREAETYALSLGLPRFLWQDALDNMVGGHGPRWLFPDRPILHLDKFKEAMREKEQFVQSAFQVMDKNGDGRINLKELEDGLRALEIKGNRYMPRRRISEKGLAHIMQFLDRGRPLDFDHFRDLFVMMPVEDIQNITPYYMKVALDVGYGLELPDRAKGGYAFGHLVAGGMAGVVSKTFTSPINVMLSRMQASSGAIGGNMITLATTIYQKEGVKAFYAGNLPNVLRSAPAKAIDFTVYNHLKEVFTGNVGLPSDGQRLLAGAMAGLCSTTLLYPLEVITARMAVAPPGLYNGIGGCVASIVNKEGGKALYRGLLPAMVGVMPYSGVQFAAYDVFREAWKSVSKEKELGIGPSMICGMMAGWAGMTASYPLDLIGMRMQVQGLPGKPILYKNLGDALLKIWRAEGPKAFYKGWSLATLKVVPSAAASYMTYEIVKRALLIIAENRMEVLVPAQDKTLS